MAKLYRPGKEDPQTITPTNGRTFTEKELRTAVGGYVRLIRYSDSEVLFVDKDGRDLPVNEKITELIGKELLQARLGVAHLVGNILLCTNVEAGLSKTSKTRAKLAIALCFWCQEKSIEISHHTYGNSCTWT